MKQIDLGPNDYKTKVPGGHWEVPHDHKAAMVGFFVCVAVLVAIYFVRDQMPAHSLFLGTIAFAVPCGILFSEWLRGVH